MWKLETTDDSCQKFIIRFSQLVGFSDSVKGSLIVPSRKGNLFHFVVKTQINSCHWRKLPAGKGDAVRYSIGVSRNKTRTLLQMIRLAQSMALYSASHDAILLHAALAARDRSGILMCGGSGAGKTTASNRLPRPWNSLSDDTVFLVRDRSGFYWAYPWPTWSAYLRRKGKKITPICKPVRLGGIYFLAQAVEDELVKASPRDSIIRLMASSEQAVHLVSQRMPKAKRIKQRMERFELCCDLVKSAPCFHLKVSSKGKFWEKIQQGIATTNP